MTLLVLGMPALAQAPGTPPILISGEERQAVIDLIERLTNANEGLAKGLKHCQSMRSA
jgi:hypothetical protein